MKEYFLAGIICLLNPISDLPECLTFHEDPINYYSLDECKVVATQKVNEIGVNFTSEGFQILDLRIACVVDNKHKNT